MRAPGNWTARPSSCFHGDNGLRAGRLLHKGRLPADLSPAMCCVSPAGSSSRSNPSPRAAGGATSGLMRVDSSPCSFTFPVNVSSGTGFRVFQKAQLPECCWTCSDEQNGRGTREGPRRDGRSRLRAGEAASSLFHRDGSPKTVSRHSACSCAALSCRWRQGDGFSGTRWIPGTLSHRELVLGARGRASRGGRVLACGRRVCTRGRSGLRSPPPHPATQAQCMLEQGSVFRPVTPMLSQVSQTSGGSG